MFATPYSEFLSPMSFGTSGWPRRFWSTIWPFSGKRRGFRDEGSPTLTINLSSGDAPAPIRMIAKRDFGKTEFLSQRRKAAKDLKRIHL
jgi:hypothetical protein